ncbi:MAG TPA: hypothetical protein VN458_05855 [Solirubrobacterales bacterium]|nr:hypothetical protein [Solirubrobacterales bacterium]
MARDAAKRFRELVVAGHQIPYDLEETGSRSPLPRYVPLTGRFVRDNAPALLQLDSFGSACAAIESAELAGPYLEELGIDVPPDARARAELAGTVFLCRLWADSTDFSLDRERLDEAIAELEAGGQTREDEIEVVVPLRGLRMPVVRLELATATIVRADTVEVPAEARASEGTGTAGWEPTFLAAARINPAEPADDEERGPDAAARSVEALRQLITALRLFQAGGVALGPYAWTRAGGDRWRRIATGAGRPRRGGYRLAEDTLGDLATLSRVLAYRSTSLGQDRSRKPGAVARAISRFEAGLERNVALEALNDYLLALRFVLEGGGPADLGLAMRVAALCAEPEQRPEIKAIVDRGLALERELWSGEPAPAGDGAPTAAETVAAIEELARAILRDAACGHLGADLRATADEILLADGLAVGEGETTQRGGSEEWDLPVDDQEEVRPEEELPPEQPEDPDEQPLLDVSADWQDRPPAEDTQVMQVLGPEGRMRVERVPHQEEENVFTSGQNGRQAHLAAWIDAPAPSQVAEHPDGRSPERQPLADRVAYLFPRPEPTDWNVRELSYDRRRGRAAPPPERRVS